MSTDTKVQLQLLGYYKIEGNTALPQKIPWIQACFYVFFNIHETAAQCHSFKENVGGVARYLH